MAEFDWYVSSDEPNIWINDLLIEITVQLSISSFNELVKLSGLANTFSAIRPNYKHIINNFIIETRKRLNLKGNGPDVMLTIMQYGQATVVPWDKIHGEIKEKGAVGIDYDCILKRAPPEYCIFQSHFSSEFVTEALDPTYECVFTHHLSNGDPYCRYVFKKKNLPNSELDNLGETIATIPKVEVPKEQSQAFTIYGNHMWWQAITGAFINLHGSEKTSEILMANAYRIGKEVGANLFDSNKNIGRDANSLGQFINSFEMALNQKGEYKSSMSNDISQKEITDCSCQTMSGEICNQYEALIHGMLESMNPNYELSYERKMTNGDKTCHWTIRKKGTPIIIDIAPEDPRKALALKFAHGEITEEEFERKMDILKRCQN